MRERNTAWPSVGWPKRREQIGIGRTVKGSQDRRSANFIRTGRKHGGELS